MLNYAILLVRSSFKGPHDRSMCLLTQSRFHPSNFGRPERSPQPLGMGKQVSGLKKLDDDPCSALAKASLKCLETNLFEKEKCQAAFDEYKACKKKETETRRERRIEERKQKSLL